MSDKATQATDEYIVRLVCIVQTGPSTTVVSNIDRAIKATGEEDAHQQSVNLLKDHQAAAPALDPDCEYLDYELFRLMPIKTIGN
jgi:hypothetical protein